MLNQALINANKALEESMGGAIYASKINGRMDVRIPPPQPHMGGLYYFPYTVYNINKKTYVCPTSIDPNAQSAVKDMLDRVAQDNDPSVTELASKIKRRSQFAFPCFILNADWTNMDANGNPANISIRNNKPEMFVCGKTLVLAINKVAFDPGFQNQTQWGIFDADKGFNLGLTKSGTGIDTKYGAGGWRNPMQLPAQYLEKLPDPVDFVKKQIKPYDEMVQILNQYLYGNPTAGMTAGLGTPAGGNLTMGAPGTIPQNTPGTQIGAPGNTAAPGSLGGQLGNTPAAPANGGNLLMDINK